MSHFILRTPYRASTLAAEFGLEIIGPDAEIAGVASLESVTAGLLSFAASPKDAAEGAILVVPDNTIHTFSQSCTLIPAQDQKLAFVRLVKHLRTATGFVNHSSERRAVSTDVEIGENVVIEPGCSIGEGTRIDHNTVIRSGTEIGRDCHIGPGVTIGGEGFGFVRDENGHLLQFPHLGRVIIGDRVEIRHGACVDRGPLSDTKIEDDAKINGQAFIGHGARIGAGTIVNIGATVSGGSIIGPRSWIGVNCSVIQKLTIGADCTLGAGAVVIRDVPDNTTVAGNPAKQLSRT